MIVVFGRRYGLRVIVNRIAALGSPTHGHFTTSIVLGESMAVAVMDDAHGPHIAGVGGTVDRFGALQDSGLFSYELLD